MRRNVNVNVCVTRSRGMVCEVPLRTRTCIRWVAYFDLLWNAPRIESPRCATVVPADDASLEDDDADDALRWAALVCGVPMDLVRVAVEAGAPKELVSSLGRELQ